MALKLSETELRVLGVLIEKSLTHAGGYPLTMNAIVLGASQKQNREPVVDYTEVDVARALHTLQLNGFAKEAPTAFGARANRFAHNAVEHLGWDRREQAVMAELILRGRQTAGELRTRASRMAPLNDLASVGAVLTCLAEHDPPFVAELSREPGRSANRFRHLLSKDEAAEPPEPPAPPVPSTEPSPAPPVSEDLPARVARLETRVDDLVRLVGEMHKNADASLDGPPEPSI